MNNLFSCFCDTYLNFDEIPFCLVRLSSIRHSPSEPALNRSNAGHSRSSSLNRNSAVANCSSTGNINIKQISSPPDVNTSASGFHIKHSITPGYNLGTDVPVSYLGKNSQNSAAPGSKALALPMVAPRSKVAAAADDSLRRQETSNVDVLERQRPDHVEDELEDFIPMSMDKPSNLDLEDFLPVSNVLIFFCYAVGSKALFFMLVILYRIVFSDLLTFTSTISI